MPKKPKDKTKIFKNPFTGATRTIQKTGGYKHVTVKGPEGDIKKSKSKAKSGPHKGETEKMVVDDGELVLKKIGSRRYRKGGKIRDMFSEQYD
jgi:hypothetical protein